MKTFAQQVMQDKRDKEDGRLMFAASIVICVGLILAFAAATYPA